MNINIPDSEHYAAASGSTFYIEVERGMLRATGTDRLDLLHRLSTNATRDLAAGEETSTILTSDKGRIIELVRLLAFDDHVLMVLAGTDAERVRLWLDKYTIMDDFTAVDASADYSTVMVSGDGALGVVARFVGVDPPNAGHYVGGLSGSIADAPIERITVVREGRLNGAGSFLLIVPTGHLGDLRDRLATEGVYELDNPTYQTLRIEAGLPAAGHELSETYNPLEAGLSQYVSFTKGCYIGQEVIARLDSYDKVQRHLVGLVIHGMGESPLQGSLRDADDGRDVGNVTSITRSPGLGSDIALAYVKTQHAVPGLELLLVDNEGAEIARATVTKLPFDL